MKNNTIQIKWCTAFLFGIVFFLLSVVPASANGPVPSPDIYLECRGMPLDLAYVDLLIPMDPNAEDFRSYNTEHGSEYDIGSTSEIVRYSNDGYYSYMFHFEGASVKIEHDGSNSSGRYVTVRFADTVWNVQEKGDYFKLAMVDQNGNIIHVTEPIQIGGDRKGFFAGIVRIDGNTWEVTDDGWYVSPYSIFDALFKMIFSVPRVLFSVGIEILIACLFFKIKQLYKILLLNIFTQLGLSIFMSTTDLTYLQSLAIGEMAVYLVEAVAMIMMYRDMSKGRLVAFVVIANTVTLALGLLLNHLGVFLF